MLGLFHKFESILEGQYCCIPKLHRLLPFNAFLLQRNVKQLIIVFIIIQNNRTHTQIIYIYELTE